LLLDIFTSPVPADQRLDRETMTQIMNAGSAALSLLPKPDLPRQPPENAVDILMQEATTFFCNEEIGTSRRSKMYIPAC